MPDLDRALDELYGTDLGEFVAVRKRLVKELKDAGDAEGAAAIGASRKPTTVAWGINQLTRRRRKDVDLLLDAGHRLRKAQASVLHGGDQAEFAAARKAQQTAVARLAKATPGISAAMLEQVTETLRAASVTDEGRELLARGRFEKPLQESSGFDAIATLAPATPPRRKAPSQPKRDDGARRAKAKAELHEAEQEAKRLRREAERAEAHARDARAAADRADRRVESLKQRAR